MNIEFSDHAKKEWNKLPLVDQKRLGRKLKFFSSHAAPLLFAKPLKHSQFGQYRFRIGDYRLLFDIHTDTIYIVKVGHRRDVYR